MEFSIPRLARCGAATLLTLSILSASALAQDAGETDGALSLELNTLQETDTGCLFTFVAENGLEASLEKAAYEVVLFNGEGLVERMTVLDFQDLPAERTRVRQFNLSDTSCGDVSRVLINDVSTCSGDGVEPATCMDRLSVSSQSDVEFAN
ncbi:hypothetical protein [Pararhizobium haloflavum]|uniref:hypothetical protein n=1 Tax=Pararhizobium haloflavum TaxID=2037914 RepID=UPI000C174BA5|nr:hypothetical protein [Pararhizobium haloflavum]